MWLTAGRCDSSRESIFSQPRPVFTDVATRPNHPKVKYKCLVDFIVFSNMLFVLHKHPVYSSFEFYFLFNATNISTENCLYFFHQYFCQAFNQFHNFWGNNQDWSKHIKYITTLVSISPKTSPLRNYSHCYFTNELETFSISRDAIKQIIGRSIVFLKCLSGQSKVWRNSSINVCM